MIAEIGLFSLALAFVLSLSQSIAPIFASYSSFKESHIFTLRISLLAGFILLSFLCLVLLFIVSDFSVALVAEHSHTSKPMIYKISGTWGNHEGFLMWILILSIFSAGLALTQKMPLAQKSITLGVQGYYFCVFGFMSICF